VHARLACIEHRGGGDKCVVTTATTTTNAVATRPLLTVSAADAVTAAVPAVKTKSAARRFSNCNGKKASDGLCFNQTCIHGQRQLPASAL